MKMILSLVTSLIFNSLLMSQSSATGQQTLEFSLGDLRVVQLSGWAEVSISPGTPRMVVTGSPAALHRLQVDQEGDVLKVWEKEKTAEDADAGPDEIHIRITVPALEQLEADGLARLTIAAGCLGETFALRLRGLAKVEANCSTSRLVSDIEGVGELRLTGRVKEGLLSLSGIGVLDLKEFDPGQCDMRQSGIATRR